MNNITTFRNTVKEFEIDGYNFKADQLTVFELYSTCQEEYKKFKLKDVMVIANMLSGREKVEFLKDSMKEMSTGEELAIELQEYIQSTDGIIMILKFIISKNNPDLTDNEISKVISPNSIDKFSPIYSYALSGIEDPNEIDDGGEPDPFEAARKKDPLN